MVVKVLVLNLDVLVHLDARDVIEIFLLVEDCGEVSVAVHNSPVAPSHLLFEFLVVLRVHRLGLDFDFGDVVPALVFLAGPEEVEEEHVLELESFALHNCEARESLELVGEVSLFLLVSDDDYLLGGSNKLVLVVHFVAVGGGEKVEQGWELLSLRDDHRHWSFDI